MSNPGTTNLIGWWALDEESGTRVDAHGTNDLTDNATVLFGTGKQGNAADFDPTNSEYLSHASNSDLQTGDTDFTFACWVKPESVAASFSMIAKRDDTSGNSEYQFMLHVTGPYFRMIVFTATDVGGQAIATSAAASAGSWYFVVGWYDAAANTVYIQVNDGTVHSTGSIGPLQSAGTAEFRIGANNAGGGSGFMNGLIDEAAFYKRVLTAAERTWLYNTGSGRTYSDIIAAEININVSKSGDFIQVVTP